MINGYIILGMLCMLAAPLGAAAQQPQQLAPEQQALGQMLIEAIQREAAARSQVFSLQAQLDAAKAQAAAPKPEAPK